MEQSADDKPVSYLRLSLVTAGLAFVAEFVAMLLMQALAPRELPVALEGLLDGAVVAALIAGVHYALLGEAGPHRSASAKLIDTLILCVVVVAYEAAFHPLCDLLVEGELAGTFLDAIAVAIVAGLAVGWSGFLHHRKRMLSSDKGADDRFRRTLIVAAAVASACTAAVPMMSATYMRLSWQQHESGPEFINLASRQRMLAQRIGRLALMETPAARTDMRGAIADVKAATSRLGAAGRSYYDALSESDRLTLMPIDEFLALPQPYLSLALNLSNAADARRRRETMDALQAAVDRFTARMDAAVSAIRRLEGKRIAAQSNTAGVRAVLGPLLLTGLCFGLLWPVLSLVFAQGRLLKDRAQALHRSETLFRQFVENADDITVDSTLSGTITYVSPSCRRLGYEPEDIVGQHLSAHIHPDDLSRVVARAELLIATGVVADEDNLLRVRGTDGGYVWFENSPSLRYGGDGSPNTIVAHLRDVSRRVAAEEKAAEALGRLQSYQTALDKHAIVAIADLKGDIVFVNDRFCELSGYSREELLGQNHRIINSGVHSRRFFEDMWRTIARGQSWHGEICNKSKDGRLCWFDTLIVPVLSLTGRPEHYVSIRYDVTEQVENRQRLADSERKFRGFTTIAADWCWETNAALKFTSVTDGFTVLTGQANEWLFAQHLPAFEDLNTLFPRSKSARDAIEAKRDFRDHCAIVPAREGGARYVRLHGRVQRNESGAFAGYLGTATDITEAMQSSQAGVQAERLQSMATMAAGLAHEFNNLLGIISGHSELAKRALARGECDAKHLEPIVEASRRGARLTKSLLAFGRQRTSGTVSAFDVGVSLIELKLFLKPLVGPSYNIQFEAEEGLIVTADKDVFMQAVANMVTNARDAMPSGGRIDVAARKRAGADGRAAVEISVTDHGVGIASNLVDKIFDPFYTTKDVGKGTGLGLALIYRFAKERGGDVSVRSALGEGSTFSILLPMTAEPLSGGVAGGGEMRFDGQRAVVVDDEPAIASMLQQMLREQGFEVRAFTDPNEALAALGDERNKVDILVTDVLMPAMDGPALAAFSRSLRPGLRVLFVTGQPERLDRDTSESMREAMVLTKPFSAADLNRALRETYRAGAQAKAAAG